MSIYGEHQFRDSTVPIESEVDLDSLSALTNPSYSEMSGEAPGPSRFTPGAANPPHRSPHHHHHHQIRSQWDGSIDISPPFQPMDVTHQKVKDSETIQDLRQTVNEYVERERSDVYLDSLGRTPRYGSAHKNYEEMIDNLQDGDPFGGSYKPSGKKKREGTPSKKKSRSKIPRVVTHIPLKDVKSPPGSTDILREKHRHSKRKKHKKGGSDSLLSTATFTVDTSHDNSAFLVDSDHRDLLKRGESTASLQSTGTYTLNKEEESFDIFPTDMRKGSTFNAGIKDFTKKLKVKKIFLRRRGEISTKIAVNRSAFTNFVMSAGFEVRECKRFVKMPKTIDQCYCGRDLHWHIDKFGGLSTTGENSWMAKENRREFWNPKTHTEKFPCDSYGEIKFMGFGFDTDPVPYIRVADTTDKEIMWELLIKNWNLPIPNLLISVTGGAGRFQLKPRLQNVLQRGIINAATTTGAWIITGGTNKGVMQFVGEAVKNHNLTSGGMSSNQVVCLGISTWGAIGNKEALIDYDFDGGLFPAVYNLNDVPKKSTPMDPNHTHFILVDNGTESQFGAEIHFRSKLEDYISKKVETGVTEEEAVNVPVVLLVIEGGVNTMETVRATVEKNIPAVIVKGSGRAADFIAKGYELSLPRLNEEDSFFKKNFDEVMIEKAWSVFQWKKSDEKEEIEKKVYKCVKDLKECLSPRKLINVINLEDAEKDIDKNILTALLKANKSNVSSQLALALAWNRCDIARQQIFSQENSQIWQDPKLKLVLFDAMFTALIQQRADFVQLFIDNGVNFKEFLNVKTLWNLYANSLLDQGDTSAVLIGNMLVYYKQKWADYLCRRDTEAFEPYADLLLDIGNLFVHMLGDQALNPYTASAFRVDKHQGASQRWEGDRKMVSDAALTSRDSRGDMILQHRMTGLSHGSSGMKSYSRGKSRHKEAQSANTADEPLKCMEKELFLWACLLNKKDLAMLFWKLGKDHLGGALTACAILKQLAEWANDEEEIDLALKLEENAAYFEQLAVNVLSECYQKDKRLSHKLLVRELKLWGGTTLFQLADSYELMHFMGHTCCQTKLNTIWKGKMALYTSTWKIMFCVFCPLLLPSIRFVSEKTPLEDPHNADDEAEPLMNGERNADALRMATSRVSPQNEEDAIFIRSKTRRSKKKDSRKKLYSVNFFGGFDGNQINLISAIYYFYKAPVVIFFVNVVSYLIYLSLFSYFLLIDLNPPDMPNSPSVIEYIVWGWTVTLVSEEFRQIITRDQHKFVYKLKDWIYETWNKFDLVMYSLFIISVILRYNLFTSDFMWARISYSVTLCMCFLRFMQTFFAEKNMGPKVIMINRMLTDLKFFFLILALFILAFGVPYHANLYPNAVASWEVLKDVFYLPYWQMYGELFLERVEGDDDPQDCSRDRNVWANDSDVARCPEKNWLVPVLLTVYMILTNILLVNLLIAMFSYTFQMVQDNSEKLWRYYRFALVYEYYDRPSFAPPFIILVHIFRVIAYLMNRIKCGKKLKFSNAFKKHLDPEEHHKLTVLEKAAVENRMAKMAQEEKEKLLYRVSSTAEQIDVVVNELESIREHTALQADSTQRQLSINELIAEVDSTDEPSPRVTQSEFEGLKEEVHELSAMMYQQQSDMQKLVGFMEKMATGSPHHPLTRTMTTSHLEIRDLTSDA